MSVCWLVCQYVIIPKDAVKSREVTLHRSYQDTCFCLKCARPTDANHDQGRREKTRRGGNFEKNILFFVVKSLTKCQCQMYDDDHDESFAKAREV